METHKAVNLTTLYENSSFYLATPSAFAKSCYHYIISIGEFFCKSNYITHREAGAYNSCLIIYLLKGRMKVATPRGVSYARENDIIILDCYKKHTYQAITELEFMYVHFDGNNSKMIMEELINAYGNILKNSHFNAQVTEIREYTAKLADGTTVNESEVSALIHKFLCQLTDGMSNAYGIKYSPYLNKMVHYIEHNYNTEITIADLSRLANISPQHITRLFNKEFDRSPYQYILELRLITSCSLLTTTTKSIAEICEEIGFSSYPNFINKFKFYYGITPLQYRNNIK